MSVVATVGVEVAAVRARSQLGKNQILIRLGQVFGGATFSSRRASDVLGLDFLHTAKLLFRMRKGNLLRVAAREPRIFGGYENVYEISARGFSKIRYLLAKQGTPTKADPKEEPDMIQQACASGYMLHGMGHIGEFFSYATVKLASNGVHIPPVTDEIGALLASFDQTFLPTEIFSKYVFNRLLLEASYTRSVTRATRLQELGLIPSDIDLPLFIGNAICRKSTEPVILLGLILRGSIELKAMNDALTGRLGNVTHQHLLSQPRNLECQRCDDYQRLLSEEKQKSLFLEAENAQIKWKCQELSQKLRQASLNASQEEFTHKEQLRYMSGRIDKNMECLVIISKALNRFPNSDPYVVLVKSFIQDSFLIIATMNYTAIDYWMESS